MVSGKRVWVNVMLDTLEGEAGEAFMVCGERRNFRDHCLEADDVGVEEPFVRTWAIRFWTRGRVVISAG